VLIAFVVLWVFAPAVAAWAATIEGTVLDPSGRPVPEARVTLLSSFTGLAEQATDARGRYQFAGLRGGAYQLTAHRPGFTASPVQIEVGDDETRAAELHLELSAVEQHVVVSASLGSALAPQLGSSVSIVPEQEIEERGAQGVYEVLRGVPGVEVNQSGRRGGVTGVFIRGGNSNYNLVMVDGIQVNQFGGDFDFASLPADATERVEVTRGPQSALYGSNALTGAINVISRRGTGRPHFTARAEGGSFTTRRFATGGSGLTRGLGWAYDLARLDSGGVVANDRYRTQSAFLSLGYSRSPRRQVNFHFFGNANDAGAPGPYGSDPLGFFSGIDTVSRDRQNLFGYQGSYAEQFSSRFRQVITASVATNDLFFVSPFGDSFSNNLRGVFNTRSEITVSNQDFLVAGFEYNREQIKNTFITDAGSTPFLMPRTSWAFFAENRWSPSARLFVIGGVRVDDLRTRALPPDGFGPRPLIPESSVLKVNPRISVAFLAREGAGGNRLGGTRLHASFGTGIRAPSGFELAFTDNPLLKPERSVSFDAGLEQRFFEDRLVADATYFHNRIRDQIVVLGESLTNLSSFISDNLGNARTQGMELSFRVRPLPSLALSAQYTLLDAQLLAVEGTNQALSPFQVGQRLLRRPRNSGAYNVTWRRGKLMLNTNAYLRGRVLDVEPNLGTFACVLGLPCLFDNPGYTRADAGFAYRLHPAVEIYGRVHNFLNRKYEESFGFPALHLNFLAGVRFTFRGD
jgi:outer membrane receptor protein involved in Fe transport